ncbi:MAG: signal recognition particle receptor FtsY [Candidatus Sumerlaea sp.]|nr:signal recognition particle-docking protein FtsY [Candidatus Sumerlaea chitinivorans]GIX45399.1 MAG: signal recognition particle receptor FtsY [Candidatus Sumerlaea sp.]
MVFFWRRKTESTPESSSPSIPQQGAEKDVAEVVDEQPSPEADAQPQPQETDSETGYVAVDSEGECSPEEKPRGLFGKLKSALAQRIRKTREGLVGQIRAVIKAAGKVDEDLLERIEEILIKADVGPETTIRIIEEMREFEARGATAEELIAGFKGQLMGIVGKDHRPLTLPDVRPWVVLFVGVNGTGKTTTIGKLAAQLRKQGKKVMMVAGDTFRAAAVEQLHIWAERTGSVFVSKGMGADPAGVAFDALTQARAEGVDVVLIDTAGRLHTKTNLMEELKKIVRVVGKQLPGAPHDTLLVLDATTGQNAISQAKVFTEAIPVTGIVMTKLDGTAKGGVLIAIRNLFPIPVVKIGVGEGIDDLRDFNPQEFVDALFEDETAQ